MSGDSGSQIFIKIVENLRKKESDDTHVRVEEETDLPGRNEL